jgi:hypothetical protein
MNRSWSCFIRVHTIFVLLFVSCDIFAAKESRRVFFDSEVIGYSEPTSLYSIANELSRSFIAGGKTGFLHGFAEAGVKYKAWHVAAFARYDYYADFTPDTARLSYLTENKLPAPPGDYDLLLEVNHLRSRGLRVGYEFEISPNRSIGFYANYIKATYLLDGTISGDIQILPSGETQGNSSVNYLYTDDVLFKRPVSGPKGEGYSFDIVLNWKLLEKLSAQLTLKDLGNQISWDQAPFTTAQIDTSRTRLSDEGQLIVKPLLAGFEGFRDHEQRLPVRSSVKLKYILNDRYKLGINLYHVNSINLPSIFLEYRLADEAHFTIVYEAKNNGLGVGVNWRGVDFLWLTDSLNYKDAGLLNFKLRYHWLL